MFWGARILVTIFAATVQSALDFFLIVVVAFLTLLNSAAVALQVIILAFTRSTANNCRFKSAPNFPVLKTLTSGSLLGWPIGIRFYQRIDFHLLKQSVKVLLIAPATHSLCLLGQRPAITVRPAAHCLNVNVNYLIRVKVFFSSDDVNPLGHALPKTNAMFKQQRSERNQWRAITSSCCRFFFLSVLEFQLLLAGISTQPWPSVPGHYSTLQQGII